MAVFTSDGIGNLNNIEDRKVRAYLYKLNEDLTYMFQNLTPEDNYSALAQVAHAEEGDKIANLEMTAEKISATVQENENGNAARFSQIEQTATSLTSRVSKDEQNYNSSFKQLADLLALTVTTPSGSSSVKVTGSTIALKTGSFTIAAKNLTVDSSGNATFTGKLASGVSIESPVISGGSIKIGDKWQYNNTSYSNFEVDSRGIGHINSLYCGSLSSDAIGTGGIMCTGQIEAESLQVDDDINCQGSVYADNLMYSSDRRLKEDVCAISAETAMKVIRGLRPVTFRFRKSGHRGAGFIAQEVQDIVDEAGAMLPLVGKQADGYFALQYLSFIPLIVKVLQKLMEENNA